MSTEEIRFDLVAPPPGNVRVFEYGVRLDAEAVQAVHEQLWMAHSLYNEIVAIMRSCHEQAQAIVLEAAGEPAQRLLADIDACTAEFAAAKAEDDEDRMQEAAAKRREARRELWALLAPLRRHPDVRARTQPLYAQIGRSTGQATYQARCEAVARGLGWATANAVLDAALKAWATSIKRGRPPRFAKAAERTQQSLSLQFTRAGGLPVADLLAGKHRELTLHPPAAPGPRRYGQFAFRLGAAEAGQYATGTWQYHRPLPEGATVGMARLVARRKGHKHAYALQFLVKFAEAPSPTGEPDRRPLVAVHPGWAADLTGRRIAGIAEGADPGLASLLRLPADIEQDLQRAAEHQSRRDTERDALLARIAGLPLDGLPETVAAEMAAIRRLRPQHVSAQRLYRLAAQMQREGLDTHPLLAELQAWRREDRKLWQASTGLARRARGRRRDHYRKVAADLARRHAVVALEPLDLAEAAVKVDENTGERSEFARKARAGRVVAALYELDQAMRWACAKAGTALVEVSGPTASRCSYCGAETQSLESDWHQVACASCGAVVDRKLAGAANAWQAVAPHVSAIQEEFRELQERTWAESVEQRATKRAKMAEGRRAARARKGAVESPA